MSPEAPLGEDSAVVQLFKALAHPMRASIVYRLISSPADVTELVTFLGVSQPLVSHHLRVLRNAHLVESIRDGRPYVPQRRTTPKKRGNVGLPVAKMFS